MIYAVIAAIIFALGMAAGVKVHVGIIATRDLAAVKLIERETLRRVDKIDKAAEKHETRKVQIETVFEKIERTVDRVIEKPVYRNTCFDADGMRELQSAIDAIADAASQPAPAVSGPASTPRRKWWGGS